MPALLMRPRARRRVRVAIIGAGFGGIAAAVKLRRLPGVEFTIFEQSAGVGGTWFDNRYPGCEVDVPSHAYSFSFVRYDWPRTHATQPELLAYAEHVVDHFGLRPHLRLDTRVAELVWEESTGRYRLRTESGEDHEFDVVISALGLLSVPRYPEWPGLSDFTGVSFHTSRWEPQHDLTGKRVAVVGTGSTAAQVVPAIAPQVEQLYVFQREPGWIEPKRERAFTPRERWMYRHVPLAFRAHRAWLFYQSIRRFKGFDVTSRRQQQMRELCEGYIARTVEDPQVARALTPDYPWGCKRPILATTYYQAFNRDNVELVPHPVTSVTPTGIVDATGAEREIDVLVLSTGFQPTRFLSTLDVKGRDGRSIHDAWAERASAFLGVTVAGFPNFFVLYGPNTNGGLSIIAQLERQAELATRAVARLVSGRWRDVDTDPEAQRRYVRWIDRRLSSAASAMESGCHNYYHSDTGHNITQWPGSHLRYLAMLRVLDRFGLRGRRVGREHA
ncbi:flavin-containing monooxygenase [Dactylosporangium sp. CA-092794]|uniref:flavin-containing monooxygenase n=1 Tax=Dactylosporangium sp. CA-092794 TaxID=3239929 RepID=UPI003D90C966